MAVSARLEWQAVACWRATRRLQLKALLGGCCRTSSWKFNNMLTGVAAASVQPPTTGKMLTHCRPLQEL